MATQDERHISCSAPLWQFPESVGQKAPVHVSPRLCASTLECQAVPESIQLVKDEFVVEATVCNLDVHVSV